MLSILGVHAHLSFWFDGACRLLVCMPIRLSALYVFVSIVHWYAPQVHGPAGPPVLGAALVRHPADSAQTVRGQSDHRHQVHRQGATIRFRRQVRQRIP